MLLAEVCLLTQNVTRLAEFYKKVLNASSDGDDEVHQAIKTDGCLLTLYNDGCVSEQRNNNLVLAFTVDCVDAEYDRLCSLGVKITEPPTTRPWGARNMLFEDPDGNRIAFRTLL
jgi:predicted enzyme related to lactoylglutathione lyase